MNALWNSDGPLLVSEIYEKVETISARSLSLILKRLMNKGYIKTMGYVIVCKEQSILYAPAITVDDYTSIQIRNIYKISKPSFNIFKLLSNFYKKRHKKDFDEIILGFEEYIDKYNSKNNKDSE